MALLWLDGFDHYTTNASASTKYQGGDALPSAANARFTGQAIGTDSGSGAQRFLGANYTTLILGAAFKSTRIDNQAMVFGLLDSGAYQCSINVENTGQITVRRGGSTSTIIGNSGANLISKTGVWYYIEAKITIDPTAGVAEVRVNGSVWISLTSQDTNTTANTTCNSVMIGTGNTTHNSWMDDYYILDTTGPAPTNDFLGDSRVETLLPTGAGNYTQFTPSTGSNWQNVDDTTPNDATDYNSSSTPGQKDTYAMADLASTGGTIYGVSVNVKYQKADAGSRTVRVISRHGGVDGTGTTFTPGAGTWEMRQQLMNTNPSTSLTWTPSQINAAEFGLEVVS